MVPSSARMNPSHISTVVVLPAPLGPSRASTSARCTSRSSWFTAVVDPYRLLTPRSCTTASEREVTETQRRRPAWGLVVGTSGGPGSASSGSGSARHGSRL